MIGCHCHGRSWYTDVISAKGNCCKRSLFWGTNLMHEKSAGSKLKVHALKNVLYPFQC